MILFMILAAGLNGFCAVNLLQHHDSCQMVGEGHWPHGQLEIRLVFDTLGHTKGRTN